jgi:hypothetical protein
LFFNAFWAKTSEASTARFWMVEPSKQTYADFYAGNMEVSIRDVLHVFGQIDNGSLLLPNVDYRRFPEVPLTFFEKGEAFEFPPPHR